MDGPADASWVENLNTVLDENKILCLANGQRIKIPNNLNIIFELDDLNHLTPATVTRCGILYFDLNLVDWKDIFER